MTEKEFNKKLSSVLRSCMKDVVSSTPFKYSKGSHMLPRKTGKLSTQGFTLKRTSATTWDLYIDTNVVPYAEYLDDISKVTHGYWSNAMEYYIRDVSKRLGGRLTKGKPKLKDKPKDKK